MKQLADDVYILDGFPKYAINIYLIGDVLLDAGTKWAKGRIMRQIKDRTITAHALTHAHPDHQGASHFVCTEFDIPLWCGEGDADAMEDGDISVLSPQNANLFIQQKFMTGPAHPVAKRLKEGDTVAGFDVLEAPGHSPGQVAYWRESDRLLILGDVLNGMNLVTTKKGLHEPPVSFTIDPAQNRDSARKLAKLNPQLVCFGHGPPWRDPEGFQQFIAALPE